MAGDFRPKCSAMRVFTDLGVNRFRRAVPWNQIEIHFVINNIHDLQMYEQAKNIYIK